jgi:FAD/FMN-containing dehydrogenase
MTEQSVRDRLVSALGGGFSGQLLCPNDAGYEEARKIQNGMIDKRPAAIARCLSTADVVAAVNFARANGLEIAVRGGGHNVAGNSVCEGGLMIDLSLMKGIAVDPKARTARAQGGVTWGEFNAATQQHGLASTGGVVSTTGIAGLTLGGGLGWLMGKYGLAVDNLIAAEVVTADGQVLRANNSEHSDLFWGLRGGGGNFGVVTSFEYQLHPVGPQVIAGLVAHPIDKAAEVVRYFRNFTSSLPDEITALVALTYAPDGSGLPIAGIGVCHCGSLPEGEAAVRPVKELGQPVIDVIGPMPYEEVNKMMDATAPKGALNYWKSSFLAELSDAAIEVMVDQFSTCPSIMSGLFLEHVHGAATRVGTSDTAFAHRQPGYNFLVVSQWLDPNDSERNIAWAREAYQAMRPFMLSGRYVNYLDADEGEDPAAAAYGPNYARLRSLKDRYDPTNLFHLNQNIRPSAG